MGVCVSTHDAVSQSERGRRCTDAGQRAALQVCVRGWGGGKGEGNRLRSRVVGYVVERRLGGPREWSRRGDAAGNRGGVARHVHSLRGDGRLSGMLVSVVGFAEDACNGEGGRSGFRGRRGFGLGRRDFLLGSSNQGSRQGRDLHLQGERLLRRELRERPREGQWEAHSRDTWALHAGGIHRHHSECIHTDMLELAGRQWTEAAPRKLVVFISTLITKSDAV